MLPMLLIDSTFQQTFVLLDDSLSSYGDFGIIMFQVECCQKLTGTLILLWAIWFFVAAINFPTIILTSTFIFVLCNVQFETLRFGQHLNVFFNTFQGTKL
jgi:hypothetical protein